jgi:hypothetical protein
MPARTKSSFIEEYQQYSPTALKNLDAILRSDIANYEESITEAVTPEWKQYWQGMKQDAQTELSVCQEYMQKQQASAE